MIPFGPFHVKGDVIVDRFGGHVCHVDPWGVIFSDEMRGHLAEQLCDALNRDARAGQLAEVAS